MISNKRHAGDYGSFLVNRQCLENNDSRGCSMDSTCDTVGQPIKRYYGISLPPEARKNNDSVLVWEEERHNHVQDILKGCRGARFKLFSSKQDAEIFSHAWQVSSESQNAGKSAAVNDAPISVYFPTPKTYYNQIANMCSTDNDVEIQRLVWSNPRHIMDKDDNVYYYRSVWKETFLTIAAKYDAHKCLRVTLEALDDTKFYETVYPSLDNDNLQHLRRRLVEQYVNSQKTKGENTPLHIATRFGAEKCVDLLTLHYAVKVDLKNQDGFTPGDDQFLCSACPDKDRVAPRIRELLKPRYIVPLTVARKCMQKNMQQKRVLVDDDDDVDQVSIHAPVTMQEVSKYDRQVIAYMGPITDHQRAHEYFLNLKKAVSSPGGHQMRREDLRKGNQRVARILAWESNLPWNEHWDFLQKRFAPEFDLRSPEVLSKVESHLATLSTSKKEQRKIVASSLPASVRITTTEPNFLRHRTPTTFADTSPPSNSQRRLNFEDVAHATPPKNGTVADCNTQTPLFESMQDITDVFSDLYVTLSSPQADARLMAGVNEKFTQSVTVQDLVGEAEAKAAAEIAEEKKSLQEELKLAKLDDITDQLDSHLKLFEKGEPIEREVELFLTPSSSPNALIDVSEDYDLPFWDADNDPSMLLDDEHAVLEASFMSGSDVPGENDRSLYFAVTDGVNASAAHVLSNPRKFPHVVSWISKMEKVGGLSPSPNRLQQQSGYSPDFSHHNSSFRGTDAEPADNAGANGSGQFNTDKPLNAARVSWRAVVTPPRRLLSAPRFQRGH